MNCSEHERCKTVCVKSDIKLLILKTLMIFKFRFLGWRTGLSKATHMKSFFFHTWSFGRFFGLKRKVNFEFAFVST